MANGSGEQALWAPGCPANFQLPAGANQDWFSYPLLFTELTADTSQTLQIQIDASADFYLTQIEQLTINVTAEASTDPITADTAILPQVTMLLNDSGSNRNLMQGGVQLSSIAGNGPWPHYLRHPRRFARNSAFSVTLVSTDANNDYTIFLNFEGFKTYNVG
ncbi:MAG: hypothetical protein ACRD33_00110 [Candidatus Acidiferrales bacterium]